MRRKTLSIYVPTWNRARHFNRLIESLEPQMQGDVVREVEVVASFNPPNEGYAFPSWCRVVQQQSNVGGRVNFLLGPLLTRGDYIWMIGDDDIVLPNGLQTVLNAIRTKPGIVVMADGKFNLGCAYGSMFKSYGEFCRYVYNEGHATTVTALTLCTATAFKRDQFDLNLALLKTDTMYGQHYGMLNRLLDEPVKVVDEPTFNAAVATETASIFLQPREVIAEHMGMYPRVMYQLIDYLNGRCSLDMLPEVCWQPGCGFDG